MLARMKRASVSGSRDACTSAASPSFVVMQCVYAVCICSVYAVYMQCICSDRQFGLSPAHVSKFLIIFFIVLYACVPAVCVGNSYIEI